MLVGSDQELLKEILPFEYRVSKILGKGGEGTVYLIQHRASEEKYVIKVYYEPHERVWSEGLLIYEQKVNAPELGLPQVTLLGNDEVITAIKYSHTPLHKIHWRILNGFEGVAKSLFKAFCKMQHYLMSHCGICLLDPTADNFMMDRQGRFHFIDFGWLIKKTNHLRSIEEGKFGYAVAMLLLEIHHKNIKHTILPSTGYSYDEPCIYFNIKSMSEIAEKHMWVKDVVEKIRCSNGHAFLHPEFYLELSDGLPDRVALPWLVELFGNSIRFMRDVTRIGS
jgi:serine/threonine protein kinase